MMEPGRLESLGSDLDRRDSEALLEVIRACAPLRADRKAATTAVARKALWDFWEFPRLPRPRFGRRGNYPHAYPWSAAARRRVERPHAGGGYGLVLEHARPLNVLIGNLIDLAPDLGSGDLRGHLTRYLAAAVITKDEDDALVAAGVSWAALDADDLDPWSRYRTAGFNLDGFRRLGDD